MLTHVLIVFLYNHKEDNAHNLTFLFSFDRPETANDTRNVLTITREVNTIAIEVINNTQQAL
ncbi:hypothetical protein [Aquimarina sp. I32.4]|uniref:hypothetical protein n=1 Tax=Aquimarina sp. I32.4 TaxID=2053903 RepID=UPI000CDF16E3|nr:hypothetical protein [Aquimarina sp. I32.4]